MARRPTKSPVEVAAERLAGLAGSGTTPAKMARAARLVVAGWRSSADSDIALRWTAALHADVVAGLVRAEEPLDGGGEGEGGVVKPARNQTRGQAAAAALRAARDALAAEMGRM